MKSLTASRFSKAICSGLFITALLLGALHFIISPKFTKIGEGVTVVQFLNGGGPSWLIEDRGGKDPDKGGPSIIELSNDKNSIVEVRSIDGSNRSKATVSPVVDPESPFPASREELEDACLLVWRFQNPEDLAADEYATTEWRIDGETIDAGLSFEGVPPGQEVMVLLWTGDFMEYYRNGLSGDPPDGMPYCIRYPGKRKDSPVEKWGRMTVPKGWEEPYGNLGSGDYVDGGWLMLQCNRKEGKTGRYYAFLELVYRFKPETDSPLTEEKSGQ